MENKTYTIEIKDNENMQINNQMSLDLALGIMGFMIVLPFVVLLLAEMLLDIPGEIEEIKNE